MAPTNNEFRGNKIKAVKKNQNIDGFNRNAQEQKPYVLDLDPHDIRRKIPTKSPEMVEKNRFAGFVEDLAGWWNCNALEEEIVLPGSGNTPDIMLDFGDTDGYPITINTRKVPQPLKVRAEIGPEVQVVPPTGQKNQIDTDNVDKVVEYCRKILQLITPATIEQWHTEVECDPDEGEEMFVNIIYVILNDVLGNTPIDDLWQITVKLRQNGLNIGNETNYKKPISTCTTDKNRQRYMRIISEGIIHYIHTKGFAYFQKQDTKRAQGWNDYELDDLFPLQYAKKILKI